jgi:hypothetical protein
MKIQPKLIQQQAAMSNTKLLLHYGHFHSSDDKNGQKKIT